MKENELTYYYPYKIERQKNFRLQFKNRDKFFDKHYGEYKFEVTDNGSSYSRDDSQFSILEKYRNRYIVDEFLDWEGWYKNGRNIFSFSEELLMMLENSDVNDVTDDCFHLPYDCFFISLKPLDIKIAKNNDKIIEGVYIHNNKLATEEEDYSLVLHFHFVGDFLNLYLNSVGEYIDYLSGDEAAKFWNFSLFFIPVEGKTTVKVVMQEAIELFKAAFFPKQDDEEDVEDKHLDLLNHHLQFIQNTLKTVINCLLYLSLPKEEQDCSSLYPIDLPHNFNKKLSFSKTKTEKEKTERKISESGFSKICYVGQTFKKEKSIHKTSESKINSHWRRGHWRNQPFGKELKEKRLQWIKPTIVNKELGSPEKGHVYVDK